MIFLILFSLFLFPAFGESPPDYDKPYSPIYTDKPSYTWTDKVKITINAPSWNTSKNLIDSIGGTDEHFIKISTGENFLKPYRFTETHPNSGVFSAEVILTGFPHDANGDGDIDTTPRTIGSGPTSGFLESERDSAITISFEFANGVVLTESAPISWNIGEIEFLKEIFLSDDPAVIRVVDIDMNLNPETLDSIPVQLYSDSDVAGITVDAIETTDDSGMFVGTVSLSQSLPSSGNRLYALPGDEIFAKYDDYTLPKPHSISDNLKVETSSIVDSSIPPTERLLHKSVILSDSLGNELSFFSPNNPVQIVGTIANAHEYNQKFVYLFQVKNTSNSIESISWVQGELSKNQSSDISQYWVPRNSGTYTIETFVWNSINDPTALAPLMSTLITVE